MGEANTKQLLMLAVPKHPASGIHEVSLPTKLAQSSVQAKVPLSWCIAQAKDSLFHTRQATGAKRKLRFTAQTLGVLDEKLTGAVHVRITSRKADFTSHDISRHSSF